MVPSTFGPGSLAQRAVGGLSQQDIPAPSLSLLPKQLLGVQTAKGSKQISAAWLSCMTKAVCLRPAERAVGSIGKERR